MKVVLIHPPHPNSTDDRLDPPLGLLYIAAHLRSHGHDVEIADLSGQNFLFQWKIPHADLYGITAYISTLGISNDIIKLCRSVNRKAKIVVGGAHPSVRPFDFHKADHIVIGPGELAMVLLAGDQPYTQYRRNIHGPEPQDYFPFPAYDLIDPSTYHRRIAGEVSLPYLTSRGCPFQCSFCGLNKMHDLVQKVKLASPKTVYDHIFRIKNDLGIDRIAFQDDIFTIAPKRLYEILDLIRPLNIRFTCMGRAGYDREETYQRLAEAGCERIAWGIESGSQRILDLMNKRVRVQDNYNVIQLAKQAGIAARAFFIIGFPGETAETLEETKKFIEDADPDQYFVSTFVPYPGTDVGDNPEKYGITAMSDDFNQFYQVSKDGTGGMTIDTKWLTRQEFRKLELDFRAWMKNRKQRGNIQDYERKVETNNDQSINRNTHNEAGFAQEVPCIDS